MSSNVAAFSRRNALPHKCKRIVLKPHPPRHSRPILSLRKPPHDSSLPTQLLTLHATLTLLQHLHIRNRNQHRTQSWYKPFNILRRTLHSLLSLHLKLYALQHSSTHAPTSTSSTTSPPHSITATTLLTTFTLESTTQTHLTHLSTHLRETLLPACYIAFSSVVADLQFAPLGVVLMGVLGDVASVVGLPTPVPFPSVIDEGKKRTGQRVVEVKGRVRSEMGGERGLERDVSWKIGGDDGDDLGEVVEREEGRRLEVGKTMAPEPHVAKQEEDEVYDMHDDAATSSAIDVSRKTAFTRRPEAKARRKSKRKKNAIDDLFAGFD